MDDAGNFNYAVTGYVLFTEELRRLGVREPQGGMFVEWYLRLGGGLYQIFEDALGGKNNFSRTDVTWYGEDKLDVGPIDSGFRYARFLGLERIANEVGVKLDPTEFGVRESDDMFRSYLFEKPPKFDVPSFSSESSDIRKSSMPNLPNRR